MAYSLAEILISTALRESVPGLFTRFKGTIWSTQRAISSCNRTSNSTIPEDHYSDEQEFVNEARFAGMPNNNEEYEEPISEEEHDSESESCVTQQSYAPSAKTCIYWGPTTGEFKDMRRRGWYCSSIEDRFDEGIDVSVKFHQVLPNSGLRRDGHAADLERFGLAGVGLDERSAHSERIMK